MRRRVFQLGPGDRGPAEPVAGVELGLQPAGRQRLEFQLGGLAGRDQALKAGGGPHLRRGQDHGARLVFGLANFPEDVTDARQDRGPLLIGYGRIALCGLFEPADSFLAAENSLNFPRCDDDWTRRLVGHGGHPLDPGYGHRHAPPGFGKDPIDGCALMLRRCSGPACGRAPAAAAVRLRCLRDRSAFRTAPFRASEPLRA
jgi:hypothetical protein